MASTASFRRRKLSRELREIRDRLGMTAEAVADMADISQASMSRTENAVVQIKVNTVKALLDIYGVTGEQRDLLLTLARTADQPNWWHAYGDALPEWFEPYMDLEGEAETLTVYDTQFVNGLLQTEDYARTLIAAARPEDSQDEIDRRVNLRMQRQERVTNGDLRLRLIVDECVLHRSYGGSRLMPAQIRRILEVADLRTVTLQVLPADSPTGAVGSFSIIEFPVGDPPVVYVENDIGALYMEKPEQVRQYSRLCDRLRAVAMSPEASVTHIAHLLEE